MSAVTADRFSRLASAATHRLPGFLIDLLAAGVEVRAVDPEPVRKSRPEMADGLLDGPGFLVAGGEQSGQPLEQGDLDAVRSPDRERGPVHGRRRLQAKQPRDGRHDVDVAGQGQLPVPDVRPRREENRAEVLDRRVVAVGGNILGAIEWTDRATKTFGGSPRFTPHKIRLLRKAGRTAEAGALAVDCSLNAPDWKRACQEANQTPAGRAQR
jgi:hypothetical protein